MAHKNHAVRVVQMKMHQVESLGIVSYRGKNFVKMSDSHCVSCKTGKDAILGRNDVVEYRGQARACAI